MLQPKKTKFRKAFKGKIHGLAKGGTDLNFGSYGLKALEPERITARQIEAARRAITRHIKRQGRLWIRVFPDVPVTKKPAEVRQGKGKGAIEFWAARVKPGRVLFELDGVPGPLAAEAFEPCGDEAADQDQGDRALGRYLAPGRRQVMAKIEDLRTKTDDQLDVQLVSAQERAFNLRFQAATNQLERSARVKEVRREIAQIKTLQGERSKSVQSEAAKA